MQRDLDFDVDDWIFMKVSPSVMRFRRKGKSIPRYIGSYRILRRIGRVAYELDLPPESKTVHPVYHVSMLRKCIKKSAHLVPTTYVQILEELSYVEVLVAIVDRQLRRL